MKTGRTELLREGWRLLNKIIQSIIDPKTTPPSLHDISIYWLRRDRNYFLTLYYFLYVFLNFAVNTQSKFIAIENVQIFYFFREHQTPPNIGLYKCHRISLELQVLTSVPFLEFYENENIFVRYSFTYKIRLPARICIVKISTYLSFFLRYFILLSDLVWFLEVLVFRSFHKILFRNCQIYVLKKYQ